MQPRGTIRLLYSTAEDGDDLIVDVSVNLTEARLCMLVGERGLVGLDTSEPQRASPTADEVRDRTRVEAVIT